MLPGEEILSKKIVFPNNSIAVKSAVTDAFFNKTASSDRRLTSSLHEKTKALNSIIDASTKINFEFFIKNDFKVFEHFPTGKNYFSANEMFCISYKSFRLKIMLYNTID